MTKTIRHFSAFSGIGAWEKALKKIGVPTKLVGYSEIDKYARKAFSVLNEVPESMNYGDITKINEFELPDFELITYSFPCQSFSVAGKGIGVDDVRGQLFFDALRIIKCKKPLYALAENVKGLTSKKHKEVFNTFISLLNRAGYNTYWKVLNSKDYGTPQNRERVYMISIRKDIDDGSFNFPAPVPLTKKLKDILEDEVDSKYYIPEERCRSILKRFNVEEGVNSVPLKFLDRNQKECLQDYAMCVDTVGTNDVCEVNSRLRVGMDISHSIRVGGRGSCDRHSWDLVQVGMLDTKGNEQVRRVYSPDGISPTLNTCQGGHREPKILLVGNVNPSNKGEGSKILLNVRIRKLTPLECLRLMDFEDDDYFKLKNIGISDTQLYKMAGNSITVNTLVNILGNLF